ncbi:MAG: hypothetical protein V1743_01230 [Nanoarchaeota archaeon]
MQNSLEHVVDFAALDRLSYEEAEQQLLLLVSSTERSVILRIPDNARTFGKFELILTMLLLHSARHDYLLRSSQAIYDKCRRMVSERYLSGDYIHGYRFNPSRKV